jgi:isopenicillin-N epimerase
VAGLKPEQIVHRLVERKIVASATPYASSYGRLAPGLLNNPNEIERALAEVRALAKA